MIFAVLQIGAVAALAVYLIRWRAGLRRRNAQSWESMLARLRPDWSAHELSDHFLWTNKLDSTPEETWESMHGPKGLRAMYRNASVMMEMAEYAAKNSVTVSPLLLETLRTDAMHIRLLVVMALVRYPFNAGSERVRVNAYRAAQMYVTMASRMMELLQENAAAIVPDFVAAM
jgi:hypothetical protein